MRKVLGLFLMVVGGFLLFEGFERRQAGAAQPALAATGWVSSLEASPRVNPQFVYLAAGGLLIVAGVTLGTRGRSDVP